MKWYKRDPDAALVGMAPLTMEERGAYNGILDVLYSRDGDVPDDDEFIARSISCDVRTWRAIKPRLIAKGKIWRIDTGSGPKLSGKRVDSALKEAKNYSESQSNRAKKRWKSTSDACHGGNANTTTSTYIKKTFNGTKEGSESVDRMLRAVASTLASRGREQ